MDPKNLTHASFFDLDNTLLNANCSVGFGKYLYQQSVISFPRLLQLGGVFLLHKSGVLSIAAMQAIIFQKLFFRQPRSFFERHVDRFLDEHLDGLLNVLTVERLKIAQNANHFVAILSSSPDFLVEPIAKKFGVSYCKATSYATDRIGCFSHIECILQGNEKAEWVTNTAKELSLNQQNIAVFTDSVLDLPFLKCAGVKVAVNPDRKLRKLCLRNHWEIL
jgi:phosphoserine phosphatase